MANSRMPQGYPPAGAAAAGPMHDPRELLDVLHADMGPSVGGGGTPAPAPAAVPGTAAGANGKG
jgi:hypothetical protein